MTPSTEALPQHRNLKVKEVAQAMGGSRDQIYKLIGEGILPCVRLGRTIRVSRKVAKQLINSFE